MQKTQNWLIAAFSTILLYSFLPLSSPNERVNVPFDVHKIYPYIALTQPEVVSAKNLRDLDANYNPSWVREYISVDILTLKNGKTVQASNKGYELSAAQKNLLKNADEGAEIQVNVKYIPENTLKNNEPKSLNFKFVVQPQQDATYPKGEGELLAYLQKKAIDKIPAAHFQGYDLTMVKFKVDEKGLVSSVHIFGAEYQKSSNEKVNQLLLEAVKKMPRWSPARYASGKTVAQEFVLTVGNKDNCALHLLKIEKD